MDRKVDHITNDILETIERVRTKTAKIEFAEFDANWELQFIVEAIAKNVREGEPD